MAFVALQINGASSRTKIKTTDGGGTANATTGTILIDALDEENFTAGAETTTNPVEDGADITDHIILKPTTLSIKGVVTATPFGLASSIAGATSSVASSIGAGLGSALGNVTKAVGGVASAVGGGLAGKSLAGLLGQEGDRNLEDVVNAFRSIRDSKKLVTIQTGLQLYTDYVLTNFSVSRDKTTGGSIRVSLDFQEFITASSETALVNVPIPKSKNALKNQNKGRKVAKTEPAKQDTYRSLAKSGLTAVKGFFGAGG